MTHGDIQLALISVWEMTELDEKSPHVWVILEVKELVRKLRAENFVGAELDQLVVSVSNHENACW